MVHSADMALCSEAAECDALLSIYRSSGDGVGTAFFPPPPPLLSLTHLNESGLARSCAAEPWRNDCRRFGDTVATCELRPLGSFFFSARSPAALEVTAWPHAGSEAHFPLRCAALLGDTEATLAGNGEGGLVLREWVLTPGVPEALPLRVLFHIHSLLSAQDPRLALSSAPPRPQPLPPLLLTLRFRGAADEAAATHVVGRVSLRYRVPEWATREVSLPATGEAGVEVDTASEAVVVECVVSSDGEDEDSNQGESRVLGHQNANRSPSPLLPTSKDSTRCRAVRVALSDDDTDGEDGDNGCSVSREPLAAAAAPATEELFPRAEVPPEEDVVGRAAAALGLTRVQLWARVVMEKPEVALAAATQRDADPGDWRRRAASLRVAPTISPAFSREWRSAPPAMASSSTTVPASSVGSRVEDTQPKSPARAGSSAAPRSPGGAPARGLPVRLCKRPPQPAAVAQHASSSSPLKDTVCPRFSLPASPLRPPLPLQADDADDAQTPQRAADSTLLCCSSCTSLDASLSPVTPPARPPSRESQEETSQSPKVPPPPSALQLRATDAGTRLSPSASAPVSSLLQGSTDSPTLRTFGVRWLPPEGKPRRRTLSLETRGPPSAAPWCLLRLHGGPPSSDSRSLGGFIRARAKSAAAAFRGGGGGDGCEDWALAVGRAAPVTVLTGAEAGQTLRASAAKQRPAPSSPDALVVLVHQGAVRLAVEAETSAAAAEISSVVSAACS